MTKLEEAISWKRIHTIARLTSLNPHAGFLALPGGFLTVLDLSEINWETFNGILRLAFPDITFMLKLNVFSMQLVTR